MSSLNVLNKNSSEDDPYNILNMMINPSSDICSLFGFVLEARKAKEKLDKVLTPEQGQGTLCHAICSLVCLSYRMPGDSNKEVQSHLTNLNKGLKNFNVGVFLSRIL